LISIRPKFSLIGESRGVGAARPGDAENRWRRWARFGEHGAREEDLES
jgi:hypothetical protein